MEMELTIEFKDGLERDCIVSFDYQTEEPQELNYPGCAESVDIGEITLKETTGIVLPEEIETDLEQAAIEFIHEGKEL